MCWQCDHPEATRTDYLELVRRKVFDYGWMTQYIERTRIHPPWAYTVGLTDMGLPELVVTGMPALAAHELLGAVATHAIHAEPPDPGERIPLRGLPEIEVVELAEPSAHLKTAISLYGPRVRALQLVHADDHHTWPWEPGFRGVDGGQPVLGVRARA